MTSTRKLAAIMFTDIVGYTSLMGKDSAKALELIRLNKDIQKPLVEKHNGKWLKEMGDGAMVQFSTALDAVNCAVEIQRGSRADFDADLRIGIHLGDITIENDDVYGDGVNIAARLESIADPGGIYISDGIEKAIRGQSEVQAKYLGEVKLKNVDYEVRTYALQGVGLPTPIIKEEKELSGHLFAEIQRRGLIRVGISYLLVSLLLILFWDQLQKWGITLPPWSLSFLYIALGIGFPVALFFAWNYERSPEGFVKTTSAESWQNPFSASQRKPLTGPYLNIALVLILLFFYLYPGLTSENQDDNSATPLNSTVIEKSIVVLPFEDMSQNQDQEYFSNGMMEEILNHLVKIEDLKVVSRTTSMRYKGSDKTTKEIADELGVATVLEGSVRKEGDRVRITVQLIEGSSNMHLFSESYDRQMTSIFDVQSEVAQLVASALQAQVSPELKLRIEAIPTLNSRAYELYLKGRESYSLWWSEWDTRVIHNGIKNYNEAIALDPEFSNAYAGLGQAYWMLAHWSPDYDPVFWDLSKKYLNKAIELDPNNGWAYAELAVVQHNWDWDQEGTIKSFEKAIELSPGNYDVHNHLRVFSARIGDCENYEKESRIISALENLEYDPQLDFELLLCQGDMELISGLNPGDNNRYFAFHSAFILMFQGKYEECIQFASDTSNVGPDDIWSIGLLGEAHALLGDSLMALQVIKRLNEMSKQQYVSKGYIAPIYMALGNEEKAFQLLEEVLEERDFVIHVLTWNVSFYKIQDDPRFVSLMERSWIPLED